MSMSLSLYVCSGQSKRVLEIRYCNYWLMILEVLYIHGFEGIDGEAVQKI